MAVKEKKVKKTDDIVQEEKVSKKFESTYMVFAIIAVIVVFVVVIMAYFSKTYVMFSPEKVAVQYTQNTAKLDGYDALKYTILIKEQKLGTFMTEKYMEPYLTKKEENKKAPELTAEEAGAKLSQILDVMYPLFVDLIENEGFENYDKVFSEYFKEYKTQHDIIYGHDVILSDDMFAAFEGNLATYMNYYAVDCETVYGKGAEFADKYLGSGRVDLDDSDIYSAGYSISVTAEIVKEYSEVETKSYIDSLSSNQIEAYEYLGVDVHLISAVAEVKTTKSLTGVGNKEVIEEKNAEWKEHPDSLTLVKIGSMWYVDITA